ncbi:DNA-directed RNA polymerase subunit omega [Gammaproteobacteria bacterium]|nr:DNA-directed RNA polymerase subunit omega [Gammaproteobacteria bacterium]
MARITMQDCQNEIDSPFEIVTIAAERARQLHDGFSPMVKASENKPAVIALREIAAGKLTSEGLQEEPEDTEDF